MSKDRHAYSYRWLLAFVLPVVVALGAYAGSKWLLSMPAAVAAPAPQDAKEEPQQGGGKPFRAPELDGGVAWLNTAAPIHLRDLKGKIVLLDFWTLCCINCIHTLPDLARLEKKFANQLVVVGVHSAKFENERNSESIRNAILRYEISHPVVNDANMAIWRAYGAQSWPTLVLIDPEGNYVAAGSGEGLYAPVEKRIEALIKQHRAKKTLNEEPLRFDLARFQQPGDTPLFFPGKILADAAGGRLFIADSTHHRIVITDLGGKKIAVAGTGEPARTDGPFEKASFNDPQGMALRGETLYVADRKNDLIRALDLKARTVKTIAGTGQQGEDRRGGTPALNTSLNSPWDLYLHGNMLLIAMAGHHQIWTLDLDTGITAAWAGNGREEIRDGSPEFASFAQPSGLASDGTTLFVADSEVSAIRAVPLNGRGEVKSIVGEGLFEFGDTDGVGATVRLQHALGVAFHDGKLYVADTYNSKIKVIDPAKQSCTTFLGGKDEGWLTNPTFTEPGGLSFAGDKMYVADTNNHRIRVVDMKTRAVSTLPLKGVAAPRKAMQAEVLSFPNPTREKLSVVTVPGSGELALDVSLHLPSGTKLNAQARTTYVVETLPGAETPWSVTQKVPEAKTSFQIKVPLDKLAGSKGVRLSLVYYECEGAGAICRVKSQVWDVPLQFDAAAMTRVIHLTGPSVTKNENKAG